MCFTKFTLFLNRIEAIKITKPISIAILAPYNVYPPRTGGKKFIAFFYEYLSKILPVTFISVADNKMPDKYIHSFHGILGKSTFRYANPLLYFKIIKIIREKKITDLIIVHPYYGWLAWLLKKSTGIKLSMLSHNIEAIRFKSMGKPWWKMLWVYEKKVHTVLDNNFFVTQEDLDFAVKNYGLKPSKCFVITYGIEWQQTPTIIEKQHAGILLRKQHDILLTENILLFNGTLDYLPNLEAINYILNDINPILLKESNFKYKIIICGKGLPLVYNDLKNYKDKNIIYAGFVNDINLYFKGADIFLNPVITGGGIKTKLVEALGNGLTAVSSKSGAFGVPSTIINDKLLVVEDYDWPLFAQQILESDKKAITPTSFFNHFYWGNIAAKVADIINGNTTLSK